MKKTKSNDDSGPFGFIITWFILYIISIRWLPGIAPDFLVNWLDINWVQWIVTLLGGLTLAHLSFGFTRGTVGSWKNPSSRHNLVFLAVLVALTTLYYNVFPTQVLWSWWLLIIGMLFRILPDIELLLFSSSSDTKQKPSITISQNDKKADHQERLVQVDEDLQLYLKRFEKNKTNIEALINSSSNQTIHNRVPELSQKLDKLTGVVKELVKTIAEFRQISERLKTLPERIKEVEKELTLETDNQTRIQLEQMLIMDKKDFARVKQLENNAKLADAKIRNALSNMEAIESQILLDQSNHQVTDCDNLLDDINEQVHVLQDHLEAWKEVKLGETDLQDNDADEYNQDDYQTTDYTHLAEDTNEETDIRKDFLDDENGNEAQENSIV